MDYDVKGDVAVLIGAARGIGFAAARQLVGEGGKVAIADIDAGAAEAAAARLADEGAAAIGVGCDITSTDSIADLLARVEAELGPPAILVNSAAVLDDKTFMDSAPEDWARMLDVCLSGPMNAIHAVLPGMCERGYGRIVCLASDAARVGQARLSYYAAAKAGVVALVKSVAQEVGRNGVTLNIVSPGATNTELRQEREAGLRASMGEEKYARREQTVLRMYPTRRLGEPDDIAGAILYLVSRRAGWVTGQVMSVNGGFVMP